ncbi:hypothetical protein AB0G42_22950 [Streptomyces yangpuensis]|uniref:hypothetical protein n=1 Tax=Streptomyces yangpuensis TaxID=1648182 RepID=UPI003423BA39
MQPAAHSQMVAMVKEVLPEREAGLLIGLRPWPLLAARMQQLGEHHGTATVAQHLGRLTTGTTSWQEATGPALVGRLVDATLTSLTTPPGTPGASRPRVSAAAARSRSRSRSTTMPAAAAPGRLAPAEAAVPRTGSRPHRPGARGVRGDGEDSRAAGAADAGERLRAAWWALPGQDRIAVEGFLLTGLLFAAAWRAGHLGMAQADFVLSVLLRHGGRRHPVPGRRPPAAVRPASGRTADRALGGNPAARRPRGGHGPRQRRAGGSALAGLVLVAAGWWAQWSGYEVVGTVLTLLAGARCWQVRGARASCTSRSPPNPTRTPPCRGSRPRRGRRRIRSARCAC